MDFPKWLEKADGSPREMSERPYFDQFSVCQCNEAVANDVDFKTAV